MPVTHPNQLFTRDLKHLVDPKYSAAPVRSLRSVLAAGAITAVVGLGTLVLYLSGKPENVNNTLAVQQSGGPDAPQIATQNEHTGKALTELDPGPANTGPARVDDSRYSTASQTRKVGNEQILIEWRDYKIKSGDSLARIFKNHGLSAADALRVANHRDAGKIKMLIPGRQLRIGYDQDKQLRALSFELRSNRNLLVTFNRAGSLKFEEIQEEFDKRQNTVGMVIDSSLFKAGAKAGLNDKLILNLVRIFAWDVDFAKDLQQGDRFTVVYDELVDGGASKGAGDILAAQFIGRERELYAFRHVNNQGRAEYYDAKGQNLQGMFLRTPMKISRITSGFTKKRFHPVLMEWKEHNGVDYAAPRGTPILAVADGKVSFLGSKKGYGKTIVLRHGSRYSTLYAHMSSYKSKIQPGSRIKQGQIIGFVGKTGMASAPHLHYEFRIDGTYADPLGQKLPRANSVTEDQRDKFLARAQVLMEAMSRHNTIQLVHNQAG